MHPYGGVVATIQSATRSRIIDAYVNFHSRANPITDGL
jgi:hypothetical protein